MERVQSLDLLTTSLRRVTREKEGPACKPGLCHFNLESWSRSVKLNAICQVGGCNLSCAARGEFQALRHFPCCQPLLFSRRGQHV